MILTTIQPRMRRSKRSTGWEGTLAGEREVHRMLPTTSAQHATEREVGLHGGRDDEPPERCETRQTRTLVGGSNRQSTRYRRDSGALSAARTTDHRPGRQRLNRDPRESRKWGTPSPALRGRAHDGLGSNVRDEYEDVSRDRHPYAHRHACGQTNYPTPEMG